MGSSGLWRYHDHQPENQFDFWLGEWNLTWADSNGSYLQFTRKFEKDRMVLMRDATVRGQACRQRMVRYNTIQERKLEWNWERSDDGGRTWRVLWQIHYTRKTQVKKPL